MPGDNRVGEQANEFLGALHLGHVILQAEQQFLAHGARILHGCLTTGQRFAYRFALLGGVVEGTLMPSIT